MSNGICNSATLAHLIKYAVASEVGHPRSAAPIGGAEGIPAPSQIGVPGPRVRDGGKRPPITAAATLLAVLGGQPPARGQGIQRRRAPLVHTAGQLRRRSRCGFILRELINLARL